jgi:hypothetical protein
MPSREVLPAEARSVLEDLLAATCPDIGDLFEAAGRLCDVLVSRLHYELGIETDNVAQQLFPAQDQPVRVEYPVSADETGNDFAAARFHFADGRTATGEDVASDPDRWNPLWHSDLSRLLEDYNDALRFRQAWQQQPQAPQPVSVRPTPARAQS